MAAQAFGKGVQAEVNGKKLTIIVDLDRLEEALASFQRALELNDREPMAWFNHGMACGRLERPEEALASFDHLIALQEDRRRLALPRPCPPGAWTT